MTIRTNHYLKSILAALAAGALSLGLFAVGPAEAAFPGNNGKIAFMSQRDGDWEIYTMNPDGSNPTNLTNDPGLDANPEFSPDGSKIVFQSHRDGDPEIFVMDADGSGLTPLTDNQAVDGNPTWSPDGSQIAFTSERNGDQEIYVMNSDGSDQTNLTNNPQVNDAEPEWSPDGSQIAFIRFTNGNWEIYTMGTDGADPKNRTENAAMDYSPDWSPDGSKIVFETDRDGNEEIYSMDADGSNPTNLTDYSMGADAYPAWSPDGTKIVFVSYRDGNGEFYAMDADGSGQTRLTNDPASDESPNWQADNTSPETIITSGPSGIVKSSSANLAFSSEAGASFECSLDGGIFEPCSSPERYSALANGEHTFLVKAKDIAGNVDATPASRTFTVDTIKPTVTPLKPALGSTTRDGTPAIRATVRDLQTDLAKSDVKLFLDGQPKTAFSYSQATDRLSFIPKRGLSFKRHTVKVVVQDAAGNVVAKSWSFRIVR